MATPFRAGHGLVAAAKRRHASSSVAPVASGYEHSLRPSLACFSPSEAPPCTKGDR